MKKRGFFSLLLKIGIILLIIIIIILVIRIFSKKQLDDVALQISCNDELLKRSDVLFVIPKFNNKSISENKTWCNYILSLNKTLALHGVYHTYEEFKEDKNQDYLQEGINEFEKCFGKKPEEFKPPQLKISFNNKKMIKKQMKLDFSLNELFHKSYHCSDTGKYPNWFVKIF
jgi:predicted deacetylase